MSTVFPGSGPGLRPARETTHVVFRCARRVGSSSFSDSRNGGLQPARHLMWKSATPCLRRGKSLLATPVIDAGCEADLWAESSLSAAVPSLTTSVVVRRGLMLLVLAALESVGWWRPLQLHIRDALHAGYGHCCVRSLWTASSGLAGPATLWALA